MLDLLEPLEMPQVGLDSPIAALLLQLERLRGRVSLLAELREDAFAGGASGLSSGCGTPEVWLSQFREIAGARWSAAGVPVGASPVPVDSTASAPVDLTAAAPAPIDEDFIRSLHRSFAGESGGNYRHPEYIPGLMWDLARFLRIRHPAQFDFLKVALVFRRLLWIHPFPAGNAQVARALAYAMLSPVLGERIVCLLDPAAALVDDDPDNGCGLPKGCEMFLQGLAKDLGRVVPLVCADHVRRNVLAPALRELAEARAVTPEESAALAVALRKPEFQAQDLAPVWGDQFLRSRSIRRMLEAGFIRPTKAGGRKYTLDIARLL